jgi:hypothetical protein
MEKLTPEKTLIFVGFFAISLKFSPLPKNQDPGCSYKISEGGGGRLLAQ